MKKQSGFTLVELVIVVVILGFLAVTAIPKFLDLTDQAKQANIEGMAGGFATGISLVRAQWEAEGRPNDGSRNVVVYDGVEVLLTTEDTNIRPGYIVSSTGGENDGATLGNGFDSANCVDIWNSILQQPPRVTNVDNDINDSGVDYFVTKSGDTDSTECHYFLIGSLTKTDGSVNVPDSGSTVDGNSFTYQPANSSVIVYINN